MNELSKEKKVEKENEEKSELRVDKNEKRKLNVYQKHELYAQNFVNMDNIRKQVNRREWELMKKWPKKYEFLTGESLKKFLIEEYDKRNLNPQNFNKQEDDFSKFNLETSSPVPETSSAFVGWRSDKIHDLEFTDTKYVSPKQTIEPPLQEGEFRIDKQCFIFLG